MPKQPSPYHLGQHLSGGIHQQTGRHPIGRTLCPNVENPYMVQCNSRLPLKEEPNPINRVVPFSTDLQTNLGESPSGFICNQPELPLYVTLIPDPQAWAVDALNIPFENLVAYAFPPTTLLPKVVQKLQSQICRIILIALGWPTKSWFWDSMEMSLDIPRQLPPIRTMLKQPLNNQYHANPASLNLHIWYLGLQASKNAGSLQRWQKELLLLKDSQRKPSTPPNGQSFKDGAHRNRWTS